MVSIPEFGPGIIHLSSGSMDTTFQNAQKLEKQVNFLNQRPEIVAASIRITAHTVVIDRKPEDITSFLCLEH